MSQCVSFYPQDLAAVPVREDWLVKVPSGAAQVACLVLPVVVLMGFFTGRSAGLIFSPLELVVLAMGLLLMVPVLLDGDSNWLEGAELLTTYFILGAVLLTF